MSNLYTLTQKIHELLPQINQKYGLEIKVESDFNYYEMLAKDRTVDTVYFQHLHPDVFSEIIIKGKLKSWNSKRELPAIQAPQIRQILVGLQEVLGENPERKTKEMIETEKHLYSDIDSPQDLANRFYFAVLATSQAEALCQKWLDGLNPLFDREPELVLQELLEVLESLLR